MGPDRNDWFVYYARGVSLESLDQWEAAEKDLLVALELAPEQPLVLNYIGYSWIERGYRIHDALSLVRKAADLAPDNGFIVDSLGWAYYRLGDYESAVRELERAVELEPNDPILHDHLGDALWAAERGVEAQFEWQHALDHDPDDDLKSSIETKLAEKSTTSSNPTNFRTTYRCHR